MKLIFWGTPEFSVHSLEAIIQSKHEVLAVVTTPDKQQGRGLQVQKSEVKICAEKYGLTVLQPEKFKDEKFIEELSNFAADVFVVVAFKILPPEIFELPPNGTFNLHASLLPKYRGAAPIQWALINGESFTGVTTFKIQKKVDTGNIYFKDEILIDEDDNFQTLHDKLASAGAKLVVKTLDALDAGIIELQQQDDSHATPAPKITKEICEIDFNIPAEKIHNLVRGLSPYPCAYFFFEQKKIKVYQTTIAPRLILKPGEIKIIDERLFIGTATSSLQILELQLEGRKKLSAQEFLRGFKFN